MSQEENSPRNLFLSSRQIQIMKLRKEGYSTEGIAREIGTTRQNVSILEKRGHRNLEKAIRTLNAVRELKLSHEVRIEGDIHVLDAVKKVLKAADDLNIRLNDNLIGIMTRLKMAVEKDLKNGIIQKPFDVLIFQDGSVQFT